ncbi:DNA ligase D [Rummeliibacillus sp. POC4]|uniref:DNA ligase D n=1 Tax=Rummeliibacillus sp. POC4 TaxID=2305899 RepID=UPI000E66EBC2|nr:DNA ligase D [Rummeliibacillus sp. POC4]RIJ67140.1 DNA ligase D [Rummeliibacillus sp. POC4]
MKPMLLTQSDEIPSGEDWIYETKYDGFRCILEWVDEPVLISRNGKNLNPHFPEILDYLQEIKDQISSYLPLKVDGELVSLSNNFKSQFSVVQLRGRLKSQNSINKNAHQFPCHYVVFDLLERKGEDVTNLELIERKELLKELCGSVNIPTSINYEDKRRVQLIDDFLDASKLWTIIKIHNGEGLIAKKRKSTWMSGTRTTNWLKIKNWFYVTVIVTKFDKKNGYFTGAVYQDDALVEVVLFRHGLKEEEFNVLKKLFEDSGTKLKNEVWELAPSFCVEIACIDFLGGMLREPRFHTFKLNVEPEECTWEKMLHQLKPIPESVQITHPDKPIFQSIGIVKEDYLYYLQSVAPLMLSFLRNRPLTLIRYPHGVPGESFYQKSSPEKVPDFVSTALVDDTHFILCNNIETLLWLGNQLAIEFHIPFQPIQTVYPTEIVFDLDPPSVDEFSLAVEAALQLKAIFDQFELKSFIKTSGGKGMQIYIPIPKDTFSYEQTGLFTKFVCDFLVEQNPKWFTIERLKKNRHNKLYLDYVQHREGKTIVAPYSPRGNAQGLIATPLHWDEVNRSLKPQIFSIPNVLARIKEQGNPFLPFRDVVVENEQSLNKVLQQLQNN